MKMLAKRKGRAARGDDLLVAREIIASVLFTIGVFSFLSLVFYSSRSGLDVRGAMGSVGVFIASVLGSAFGISSFLIPFVAVYTAGVVFRNAFSGAMARRLGASFVLLVSSTALLGMVFREAGLVGYNPAGGWIGRELSMFLILGPAGAVGSYIIATFLTLLSLIIMLNLTLKEVIEASMELWSFIIGTVSNGAGLVAGTVALAGSYVSEGLERATRSLPEIRSGDEEYGGRGVIVIGDDRGNESGAKPKIFLRKGSVGALPGDSKLSVINLLGTEGVEEGGAERFVRKNGAHEKRMQEIVLEKTVGERTDEGRDPWEQIRPEAPRSEEPFRLPALELLDPKIGHSYEIDRQAVYEKAAMIEQKLSDFGVMGNVTEIRPGPVITMFEYKPAPGVKINKISNLTDDLAMCLSALSVRIVAPIPGRDVVGIEVPNEYREEVVLRELLEQREFRGGGSLLTLALGKDISGRPYYTDLRKMPHLMIAGTTGSGKSVFLHSLMASMLYKATPSEIKFIMVDPKMLELSIYEGIPHLLHPVVTDTRKAAAALRWAVGEMEERYRLLSTHGVRDIEAYNRGLERLPEEFRKEHWLPYLVIVLDELADLIMVAPREVVESITRLAQKGRAAGIHLIVATQRPSADIVAGLIKANFPARISFLVSSKVDSRIIMDSSGAEELLGRGDMLFLQPGTFNLVRIQGALVSDGERKRITTYLSEQGAPNYISEITALVTEDDPWDTEAEKDELYERALLIVAEMGQASISMLQRKMKIGYNRAASIVEIMEKEGLVGPQEVAGKPREVYIDADKLHGR